MKRIIIFSLIMALIFVIGIQCEPDPVEGRPQWRFIALTSGGVWPSTSGGADDPAVVEYGTNDVDMYHVAMTAGEFIQCTLPGLPQDYRDGTSIYIDIAWTATAGTAADTISWKVQAQAYGDKDPLDGSWGSAVTVNDTLGTGATDWNWTPKSGAITIANSPVRGDGVQFRIELDAGNTTGTDYYIGARGWYLGE